VRFYRMHGKDSLSCDTHGTRQKKLTDGDTKFTAWVLLCCAPYSNARQTFSKNKKKESGAPDRGPPPPPAVRGTWISSAADPTRWPPPHHSRAVATPRRGCPWPSACRGHPRLVPGEEGGGGGDEEGGEGAAGSP
jgi:hypothetical protein